MTLRYPFNIFEATTKQRHNNGELDERRLSDFVAAVLDATRRDDLKRFACAYSNSSWRIPDYLLYVLQDALRRYGIDGARRKVEALHPNLFPALPSGNFESWTEYVARVVGQ